MARDLIVGPDRPSPGAEEKKRRIAELEATIRKYIPDFTETVADLAREGEQELLVLHQDAFAGGYDDDEYTLLGMAVKYAGLKGVGLNIVGTNGETFTGTVASNVVSFSR